MAKTKKNIKRNENKLNDLVMERIKNIGTNLDQIFIKLLESAYKSECDFKWVLIEEGTSHFRHTGTMIFCPAHEYLWEYPNVRINIIIHDGRSAFNYPSEKRNDDFIDVEYIVKSKTYWSGGVETTDLDSYNMLRNALRNVYKYLMNNPELYTWVLFQGLRPEVMCLVSEVVPYEEIAKDKMVDISIIE